jgi:hypothetical protein
MNSIWSFYRTNFLKLFSISLVMSLVVQYATTMVDIEGLQSATDPELMLEKLKTMIVPILVVSLLSLFFSVILQHYILYKPVNSSNTIWTSVTKSFRYYFPFLVLMVLLTFFGSMAIALGILALIVGAFFAALYILTLYLFILPIMMIEGPDIGRTINRTFSLVHRNFWNNLGWVAVFIILLIIVSVVLSAVAMIPFSGDMLKSIFKPGNAVNTDFTGNPLFIALSVLVNAITMPLLPIFSCILYFNAKAGEDYTIESQPQETEYRPTIEDLYSKPLDEHKVDEENKSPL